MPKFQENFFCIPRDSYNVIYNKNKSKVTKKIKLNKPRVAIISLIKDSYIFHTIMMRFLVNLLVVTKELK